MKRRLRDWNGIVEQRSNANHVETYLFPVGRYNSFTHRVFICYHKREREREKEEMHVLVLN